ncbi:hypothetical protein [Nocardia sp. NPDC047648]|uniref:hypothetical protein n=1 Tax=Nocardia sp. NPDC047648 TaxID=3155625 RepID=UPI0033DBB9C3
MCSPVTCRVCGKTTWAGCGAHIDAVRAATPPDEWCAGHDDTVQREPVRRPRRIWFR